MNVWEERVNNALDLINRFGCVDGAHHKQWVLDQVVRALTAHKYEEWILVYESGEDGEREYEWDTGIPP